MLNCFINLVLFLKKYPKTSIELGSQTHFCNFQERARKKKSIGIVSDWKQWKLTVWSIIKKLIWVSSSLHAINYKFTERLLKVREATYMHLPFSNILSVCARELPFDLKFNMNLGWSDCAVQFREVDYKKYVSFSMVLFFGRKCMSIFLVIDCSFISGTKILYGFYFDEFRTNKFMGFIRHNSILKFVASVFLFLIVAADA